MVYIKGIRIFCGHLPKQQIGEIVRRQARIIIRFYFSIRDVSIEVITTTNRFCSMELSLCDVDAAVDWKIWNINTVNKS